MNYPIEFRFITKTIEVQKASDKEKGFYITGYASVHDVVDRQDEIVTKEALVNAAGDLLTKGKTLFFNHDYSQPIGRITKATVDGTGLLIEAYISKSRPDIKILLEEGILNKFSIGGKVLQAETVRDRQTGIDIIKILEIQLYEVSLVGVPANAEAEVIDYVIKSAVKKAVSENKGEDTMADKKEKSIRDGIEKVLKQEAGEAEEKKVVEEKEAKDEEVKEEVKEEKKEKKEGEAKEEKKEADKEVEGEEKKEEKKDEVKEEESEKKDEETKEEKSVKPEDMLEKTSEKDIELAKTIEEKLSDIHKAVMTVTKPRITLFDSDVVEVVPNFDTLAIGDEVTLKVVAVVSEKAESENSSGGETYKYFTLKAVEIEQVGAVSKKDKVVEDVKSEEVENKKEKEEEVEDAAKEEETAEDKKEVEKGTRKGINMDNFDDAEKAMAKQLDGKSIEDVINDDNLFKSLPEDMQKEIVTAYKKSLL